MAMHRDIYLLSFCLLFWAGRVAFAQYDDDDEEEEGCMPGLADMCFTLVQKNIACHYNPETQFINDCSVRNENDMCSVLEDALHCTSDIIDTDCNEQDGRRKFDAWLEGQMAVYVNLCSDDRSSMKVLLDNSGCWNVYRFLTCTEQSIGINHVNDLLRTDLDINECNRLLVSLATCNMKATSANPSCHAPQEIISEILHTFFSATKCSSACEQFSTSDSQKTDLYVKKLEIFLVCILLMYSMN